MSKTKSKSFLGSLADSAKSAIFTDTGDAEEVVEQEEETATRRTTTATPPPPANAPAIPAFTTQMVGQIDPAKYAKLRTAMYPTAGPLATFLNTLTAMRNVIIDEGTAFRAVIASLTAQGITSEQINAEITAMDGRVNGEVARIGEKRKVETQTGVTDKEKRVADLNAQIEKLNQERDKLITESRTAQAEIQQKTASFDAAIVALRTEYGDVRRKLEMYTTPVAKQGAQA